MRRAISQLTRPNKLVSDAVDARMELDLRIGASFTRFQTLRLKKRFPQAIPQGGESGVVSYGSCQFPTLGFVVERFKQREAFVSEPFWKLVVTRVHDTDKKSVEFETKVFQLNEKTKEIEEVSLLEKAELEKSERTWVNLFKKGISSTGSVRGG
jgi:DNA topoisomerase-3